MSMRYKGGFIQTWFNPLSSGVGWKQYSGAWTLQAQMQAKAAGLWTLQGINNLWSWGYNNKGQLGQSNVINRSSPVQIGALTTWSNISVGIFSCLAIKTDGTLWSWGRNDFGQLGQSDRVYRSSPVQVGALTTWSKIRVGQYSCLATKTDGTLWSWGHNNAGQLGQNDIV